MFSKKIAGHNTTRAHWSNFSLCRPDWKTKFFEGVRDCFEKILTSRQIRLRYKLDDVRLRKLKQSGIISKSRREKGLLTLSRWVWGIGLLGGSLSLLAGFLSVLPWVVCGPVAGGLLVSWFGGEVKKRLDKAGEKHKEIKVIRFRQKAALEQNVSELRKEGWEPRWESYRETVTGLLIRRIIYSVVMERKPRKPERK